MMTKRKGPAENEEAERSSGMSEKGERSSGMIEKKLELT